MEDLHEHLRAVVVSEAHAVKGHELIAVLEPVRLAARERDVREEENHPLTALPAKNRQKRTLKWEPASRDETEGRNARRQAPHGADAIHKRLENPVAIEVHFFHALETREDNVGAPKAHDPGFRRSSLSSFRLAARRRGSRPGLGRGRGPGWRSRGLNGDGLRGHRWSARGALAGDGLCLGRGSGPRQQEKQTERDGRASLPRGGSHCVVCSQCTTFTDRLGGLRRRPASIPAASLHYPIRGGLILRVFDCHVHVAPWEEMKPEIRKTFSKHWRDPERLSRALRQPEEFLRLMDEEGIERAALINYPAPEVMGFAHTVNDWVFRFAAADRQRLLPVGSVHPHWPGDAAAETARLFEDLGIAMLKIHPPHQLVAANAYLAGEEALAKIYSTAERFARPVMIHTGTSIFPGARNRYADPMPADDVAVDFPKLPIILAHAGRPLYMETAVFLARRHPNVYLDISGIPPKKLLDYLPRLEELSGKCLWGTDFPSPGVLSMRKNVEEFQALPLSEHAKGRILFENAAALIK